MDKKFRIVGIANDSEFLRIELKREKGVLESLNKFLKTFGIDYLEFSLHENNLNRKKEITYDELYQFIPKYNYFDWSYRDEEYFNLHFIKFTKSVMLIFYIKRKDARNKIVDEIGKYFVFAKPKVKKK